MKKIIRKLLAVLGSAALLVLFVPRADAASVLYEGSGSYMAGRYYAALCEVRLTGDARTDLVRVALSQTGYHESNSPSSLSGDAAGSGNYTEYGRWYGLQDMWCAMFVSWCASAAGIGTDVIPKTSSTVVGLNRMIDAGRAHSRAEAASGKYTPRAGDLIYFRSDRNDAITNHVGIVTSYSGGKVHTVEGNSTNGTAASSGGAVCEHLYSLSDTSIVYICSPAYPKPSPALLSRKEDAAFPLLSRGSTGTRVRALQLLLNGQGSALSADGIFGPATEAAVRDYQRANSLAPDGMVGTLTWGSLCAGTQSVRSYSRPQTRALQLLLNEKCGAGLAVDGIFGSATQAAVLAFQRTEGIAADGIVGPVTWRHLLG